MIIRLKDSLGAIHESDFVPRDELLAEVNGDEDALNQKMAAFREFFEDFSDMNSVTLTINGVKRSFNPEYIIWVEIDERQGT